ncbi:hypothetical protein ACROYT_G023757 [Oculina patagonica]
MATTNFTGDGKQQTYVQLICSPGLTTGIHEPLAITYLMSAVNEHWNICRYVLTARYITDPILCGVSLLTLTAISVDRLLALLLGLRYRQVCSVCNSIAHVALLETALTAESTTSYLNLPILDLKVWVEHREKEVQGSNQMVSVMMYEFHTKEIASKALVNARSAMSASVKRTVLSQAVLCVLLNCSPLLPWANVVEKVVEMVLRMQYSGYNQKFRYEVVDSAIKAYRARQEAELKGERPIHRPKGWRRNERETEKSKKREDWYKKGGNEAVIFVPARPGSQLQKEYQREIRDQGYRIKVVEKTGTTLKGVLQKSDPFKRQRCGREDCLVCKQAGKGPCNAHGVTYEIECQGCKDKYIGETARNAYTRGIEHTGGLENQDEKSALWRHCVEKHEKERQEFKMSVTGLYGNDAMLRQIAESVKINRAEKGSLINTKKEWNYVKLPRVVLDEGEL